MDFIIDNYLWIAIGVVLVFMIIIGYFAEKTNFGKKPLHENKKTDENNDEATNKSDSLDETQPISEETPAAVEDVPVTDDSLVEIPENVSEVPTMPEGMENQTLETLPDEDLNIPFGDQEVKEETGSVDSVPEQISEASDEEIKETSDVPDGISIEDESSDTPVNEISDVPENDEDDVWKF